MLLFFCNDFEVKQTLKGHKSALDMNFNQFDKRISNKWGQK